MMVFRDLLFILILSLILSLKVIADEIAPLRILSSGDKTQVFIELPKSASYKITYLDSLEQKFRILVEISTNFINRPKGILVGDSIQGFYSNRDNIFSAKFFNGSGNISEARLGKNIDDTLRIVLDLRSSSNFESSIIEQGDYKILILDIDGYEVTSSNLRDIIVAIDAGHGGRDPGATGPQGQNEKDIVLSIAKKLAERFSLENGISPLLIRDSDNFVSLTDRTKIALEAKADIFLSLHADAFSDRRVNGATVYVLSEKGASDERVQALANRENSSSLFGCDNCQDDDVLGLLVEMAQGSAIPRSIKASEYIISQLDQITRLRKQEAQRAPFRVLKTSGIPSILIEMGYISNPDEEKRLSDPFFQEVFANSIYTGVMEYFIENPTAGTIIASNPPDLRKYDKTHIITEGETLSEIAEFYKIRLTRLRNANNISSDLIYIGQVLVIPGI
ncbi:MAG: hypothetical protein CBC38_06310 [Gammaproteobacteria bacterium TMED78]|nr:MAG: hypothetical protein CBC38_06310 [Gammaproteobacteria bacterium TMED78]|tara:strand:- start:35045 stop:36391 length:1347 start_codon:yes stop_codon:yes gene_type:complete